MPNPTRTHDPVKLGKTTVEAATPEPQPYVLWDTDTTGFGLKILPSGKKVFLMKFRTKGGANGKRNIGVYGRDVTPAEARKIAKDWRVIIAAGGDPRDEWGTPKGSFTFREFAEKFVEEYSKPRKRSWKQDQTILIGSWGRAGEKLAPSRYFRHWHSLRVNEITPADVQARLKAIAEDNGPIMANRCRSSINKLFEWGIKNHEPEFREIEVNPVRAVDAPGVETERERVYTSEEIRLLWESFSNLGTAGRVYMLELITGQRVSEVAGLEWAEIEESIWTLPSARTKNKMIHVVPLSNMALEIIEGQQGQNAKYVFPSPSDPDRPFVARHKHAIRVKKVVADFQSHDLRRTMSTESTRLGFSRFLVDRLLNHVEGGVGRRYDRYDYLREKTEITDAWARRLRNILEGGKVVQITKPAG